ncbi:hypothetical protein IP92_02383 [Pseudoduganella flava]|uniref:Uncharacterized protein n=1 Tax=Pseudoduganella flava TaxID=871742 RepID=A0A562PS97_9BURK|nr:hypothetical protein [Pseudoduganella flava]QGZ39362.1 hypothetical protein GO485_10100 [Pseudoduganella flava]TWI47325.1 hypothetical protein IP92_02383 [Pseudoduganella flava]
MANRAYLVGLNENFFEDDDVNLHPLIDRSYALPLLWFSLFEPDDLRMYSHVPIMLTSRDKALANIDRRAAALKAFLGPQAAPIVDHWRTFIDENAYANYLMNPMELVQMQDEEGEFLRDLRQWIAEFESIADGSATTRTLGILHQAHDGLMEYPYTGDPLHLCGHSFERPLPWERKRA